MKPSRFILSPVLGLFMVLGFCAAGAALANPEPKAIGHFDDWSAVTFEEQGNLVCYITSEPHSQQGDYTQRGRVYALVTHRPSEGSYDVVTFIAGYTYRPGSEVTAAIDNQSFTLFTNEDGAWAMDDKTDRALVEAMKKGKDMVVRGVSSRGTETTDTYSLLGFTKAYGKINEACAVKR